MAPRAHLAGLVLVLGLAAACARALTLAGDYDLVAVNDRPLPAATDGDSCSRVVGGALTLRADSSWHGLLVGRDCGAPADTSRYKGRYGLRGSELVLVLDSVANGPFGMHGAYVDSLSGAVDGRSLRLQIHGFGSGPTTFGLRRR